VNTYLSQVLKSLISQQAVSDNPIEQLNKHTYLRDMEPTVSEIWEIDPDLAELVAAIALLSYEVGVEEGWAAAKEAVRETDGLV
jgi:hypothetical protein